MTKASRLGRLVTLKNEELPLIKSLMITLSSPDIAMSCHKLSIKYAQIIYALPQGLRPVKAWQGCNLPRGVPSIKSHDSLIP